MLPRISGTMTPPRWSESTDGAWIAGLDELQDATSSAVSPMVSDLNACGGSWIDCHTVLEQTRLAARVAG